MLEEYLPTLTAPSGNPMPPLDPEIIKTLRVGVTLRNGLAHTGADVPTERLHRTLRAIWNVLWTLDEARGHGWAAQHRLPTLDSDPAAGYRRS